MGKKVTVIFRSGDLKENLGIFATALFADSEW